MNLLLIPILVSATKVTKYGKGPEYGSNVDPDPQHLGKGKGSLVVPAAVLALPLV